MVSVLIYKESRFPADRVRIKNFVENYLSTRVSGKVEVGISIVGDRKMQTLNNIYRKVTQTTDVLSFPLSDSAVSTSDEINAGFSPDKSSPDKILRLGDVVISYPQTVMEAAETNKLVDQKMEELIAHGLDHLLGIHHN